MDSMPWLAPLITYSLHMHGRCGKLLHIALQHVPGAVQMNC